MEKCVVLFCSGEGAASNAVVSAQIHPISKETFVFTLCQDYKIRVWSCQVLQFCAYCMHLGYRGCVPFKILLLPSFSG